MPLGSLLGLPKAWDASGPQKQLLFSKVFANSGFWVFEALNGPLGLILAPSWADLVLSPKWPPKWSKSSPKSGPKNNPPTSKF